MILIFPKGSLVVVFATRKGEAAEETRPSSHKGADVPRLNNCTDVHGRPVNGNHFKRSRPQCVYLANVKFSRGEREPKPIRCGDTSLSRSLCTRRIVTLEENPIVLSRYSIAGFRAWLVLTIVVARLSVTRSRVPECLGFWECSWMFREQALSSRGKYVLSVQRNIFHS
ncbi:hypothetical protein KM043_006849 [Ampulex compressa]|nr:hypothetical protein KM043_006849 [Ampulex compressa]